METTAISDAEWRVMRFLWQHRSGSAAEVIAALAPETGWQHRTIRTLLARLVAKKALAARPVGNRYVYRPLVSRERCVRERSESFLQKVFGGDAAEALLHFVRHARMSPEQIDELKRILDERRPDR